jgi:ABC-type Na+ transport system ATPase subunit NatA
MRVCDRLAIVHKGRIQFAGTLADLKARAGDDLESAFLSVLDHAA